jgi:hypothetical protein
MGVAVGDGVGVGAVVLEGRGEGVGGAGDGGAGVGSAVGLSSVGVVSLASRVSSAGMVKATAVALVFASEGLPCFGRTRSQLLMDRISRAGINQPRRFNFINPSLWRLPFWERQEVRCFKL